ncbi:MAG: class I SAM-dependent methyltransferase [Deltaproteobacteria bacterium]|nr:class I SAM-dependent methyltransferase [Deltaproteobacteria bacterium]MBI3295315.1 class I SAM-dependent methyltransferase [Deltaproteobacteria bacterium]
MQTGTTQNPKTTLPIEFSRCPICQEEDFTVLKKDNYKELQGVESLAALYSSSSDHELFDQVVQCRRCDLVYLNPRVESRIALAGYSSAQDETFVAQNAERIRTFKNSLKSILQVTDLKASPQTHVLDVGCAGGAFPKAAVDLGLSATGIEPSGWLCQFARKNYGVNVLSGTLTEHCSGTQSTLASKSFHLVTLWDVIEHVPDPALVLRQCRQLLRNEGYLVVNYPDYGSVVTRLLGWSWPFFLSVHLYYFTRATMTRLLRQNGFDPVLIRPHWQTLKLSYVIQRASALVPPLKFLSRVLDKLGLGDLPCRYYIGQTLVIAKPNGQN